MPSEGDILTEFKSKVNDAVALVSHIPVDQKAEVWNFWELITITVKLFTQVYVEDNITRTIGKKQEDNKDREHTENKDVTPDNKSRGKKKQSNETAIGNSKIDCQSINETRSDDDDCDIGTVVDFTDLILSPNKVPVDNSQNYVQKSEQKQSCSSSSLVILPSNNSTSSPEIISLSENRNEIQTEENVMCVEIIKTDSKPNEKEYTVPKLRLRKPVRNTERNLNEDADITNGPSNAASNEVQRSKRKSSRPQKKFQCDDYSYETATKKFKTFTDTKSKQENCFDCQECGKKLSNATALKVHSRQHSGQRPFACSTCGRTFSTNGNRIRHENAHKGEKNFQCDECQKWFSTSKSLQVHKRVHTGEKPYVCQICDKRFTQKGTLKSHMDLHDGVKKYLCTICGRSFTQKANLETHSVRHNQNNKQFQCQHCNSSFFTKGELARHLVKHTKDKPFLCNYCPKTFSRYSYLKEHTNLHVKEKPYSCHKCNEAFSDSSLLRKHKQWHRVKESEQKIEKEASEQMDVDSNACIVTTSEITGMKQIIMASDKDLPVNVLQQFFDTGHAYVEDDSAEVTHVIPVITDIDTNTTQEEIVDDTSQDVYEITLIDANSDSEHSNIIATVDFSAMNLLANATAQQFS